MAVRTGIALVSHRIALAAQGVYRSPGKVFDPFFSTKPVGKGTGLGLSQVHGFVHQAGGTIDLKSTVGTGTTITIFLPRSTLQQIIEQEATSSSSNGTVLLVEDNPEVANASTGLLEQLGYTVRWASDAPSRLSISHHRLLLRI